MTAPTELDPFAGAGEKAPSVKFPTLGTTVTAKVLDTPKLVQSKDYTTGELATWPDGNPKMSVVIDVEVNGERHGLWAGKPSALFAALQDALKASGAKAFEVGGTITVRYDSDKPNEKNPRLNPAKQFKAKYEAPAATSPFDTTPPPF